MTAQIIALPGVEPAPPQPVFDLATATVAEKTAWLAGRQSVIDDIAPILPALRRFAAQHGIPLRSHLAVAT